MKTDEILTERLHRAMQVACTLIRDPEPDLIGASLLSICVDVFGQEATDRMLEEMHPIRRERWESANPKQDEILTCKDALAAWADGQPVQTVSISGFPEDYELACQRLMFLAISEQLEHAGDDAHWATLYANNAKPNDLFTQARDVSYSEGMTGAMWSASISAAVVMLRNGWSKGIGMAPHDRLIVVTNPSPQSSIQSPKH